MPPPDPNADVRMRGFASRSTVEEALEWIDAALPPWEQLPTESVPLSEAAGRVLSRNIVSRVDVPAFPRSMMDGYAVRAADTEGATAYNRLPLRVAGVCLPGTPFTGSLATGQAVRIMTGAPLPASADAVLPVEQTEAVGPDTVEALETVSPGKHVGAVGEDIRNGEIVAPRGRQLRPQDLGVLSSIGCGAVDVIQSPRVRILITGNELLPAGTPPVGYRIADANGPMLAALVDRDGGVATAVMIPDDVERLRAALLEPVDVVLVSGGSSVGQEDHVPRLLAELGELGIHGIAMRPSSPTGLGRIGDKLVCLLPGNPVSCLCAYDFFAGRAIRALAGRSRDWPYRRVRIRLSRKLVSTVGRVDYARIMICGDEAEPLAISGASVLSSTTRADGFVIIPADSEGFPAGAEVETMLYG